MILFLFAIGWLAQARHIGNRFRRNDLSANGNDKKSDAEPIPTEVEFWLKNLIVGPPAGAPHISLNVNSKLDDSLSDAILKSINDGQNRDRDNPDERRSDKQTDNKQNTQNEQENKDGKDNDGSNENNNDIGNESSNGRGNENGSNGTDDKNNKKNNDNRENNGNDSNDGQTNSDANKQRFGNRNQESNSNESKNDRGQAIKAAAKDNSDSDLKKSQEPKKIRDELNKNRDQPKKDQEEVKKTRTQDKNDESAPLNGPNGYGYSFR